MSGFGGTMVWRHLDGTECCHRLAKDSEAPDGYYCAVTHSDVVIDDSGPSAGRTTVVLTDDEPVRPVFPQTPPPSRYLDGSAPRRRHRAEAPGRGAPWPEALTPIEMWAVFSGITVGVLVGLVWLLVRVLG